MKVNFSFPFHTQVKVIVELLYAYRTKSTIYLIYLLCSTLYIERSLTL